MIYFTTSEKIRIICKKRGITLTELAARLNMSRQNLARILNKKSLNEFEIKQIAAALDCSFDTVFTFNDTGETI